MEFLTLHLSFDVIGLYPMPACLYALTEMSLSLSFRHIGLGSAACETAEQTAMFFAPALSTCSILATVMPPIATCPMPVSRSSCVRAKAHVIRPLADSGFELVDRMCAEAKNHRRKLHLSPLVEWQIILTEVHSISADSHSDINPVIYDAYHARLFAELYNLAGQFKSPPVANTFGPKLDAIGPTCRAVCDQVENSRIAAVGGGVKKHIKFDRTKLFGGVALRECVLFDAVGVESQLFKNLCDVRLEGFRCLCEDAQGFSDALSRRGEAIAQILSVQLALDRHAAAYIGVYVPGGNKNVCVEPSDGIADLVAEFLCPCRQLAGI